MSNTEKAYHRCNNCGRGFRGKMQTLCKYCNGILLKSKAKSFLKEKDEVGE